VEIYYLKSIGSTPTFLDLCFYWA